MKRYKRVMILAAILMAACIATFALAQYEEEKEQIRVSDEIIMQIPSQDVTSFSWEYSTGGGLAFVRTEDGWKYREDEAFPVSEEKLMDILEHFESFGVTFVIEEVEDFAQYGLDEPECTFFLTTEAQSYTIEMGGFSTMDEQRYISIGDGKVYLVGEDPVDYVDSSLSSMILHDDTPGFEKVVNITFAGTENYTITRSNNSPYTYAPEEDIYFVEYNGKTVSLETASVRAVLNAVTGLDLMTYASYNVTGEELAAFGLETPLLSVTVNYSYTGEDGEAVEDTCVIHIGEDAEGDARYVRVGDSRIIYTLDEADFETLTAVSFNDLRHDEIFWADFAIVKQLDVALEGEDHSFISKPEGEDNEQGHTWYYGETKLEIGDLQDALEALTADSFTEELPGKDEEIGLTIHLDNENFPTVEVHLYRYDGTLCLAEVDGETVCLVSRSAVMDLVEAVQTIVLN